MSIEMALLDFLEAPFNIAQLTTFSEYIPDEWGRQTASLSTHHKREVMLTAGVGIHLEHGI
tara:strand:+ start:3120 stop:3302 length:183 start_codon:yes stop_codon:yes gene_type:complete